MQALTYHGSHDVRVERVPDPVIEQPDDIILRVTATAICGSDLHLYRGKMGSCRDKGKIHSLPSYPHVFYGFFRTQLGQAYAEIRQRLEHSLSNTLYLNE